MILRFRLLLPLLSIVGLSLRAAPHSGDLLAEAAAARAEVVAARAAAEPAIAFLMADELPVGQLARILTEDSGRTIVASRAAGQVACTAFFENAPLEECLRTLCRTNGLWLRKNGERIVEIVTAAEYRDSLALYKDECVEVVPVRYPAAADIGAALGRLYADRVVWVGAAASDLQYTAAEEAIDRMDLLLDRAQFGAENAGGSSGSSSSGSSGSSRSSTSSGNSRSSASGRTAASRSSAGLSNADQQLTASLALENQWRRTALAQMPSEAGAGDTPVVPGLVYLSVFPDTNSLLVRSHDRAAVDEIKAVVARLDVAAPQVLLEVRVLELSIGNDYEQGVDWDFASGKFASVFGSEQLALTPTNTLLAYTGTDIAAKLKLYAKDGRLTALATPTLLVRDNEASRIFIGEEATILESVSYKDTRTVVDGVSTGSLSIEPETSRRNLGNTLLIAPKIHPDRSITLRILHENSQSGTAQRITYGGDDTQYFESTPVEQSTITTTVVARDREPVVIGGLIREKLADNEEGVPLLRKIPLLGNAFKQKTRTRSRSELIVIVRPVIQQSPAEAAPAARGFLDRNSLHPAAGTAEPALDAVSPEEVLRTRPPAASPSQP